MVAPYSFPPLNGLRAFEAAARHMSFQKAAEELHVTPGAISQQIKKLEDIFQTALFHRDSRAVTLTKAGQRLQPGLSAGFESLDDAVRQLKQSSEHQHITVSVTPSFAAKWLVPRLEKWTVQYPDVDVRISASLGLANFGPDGVDLGVRFGSGNYGSLTSSLLLKDSFVVVCSPIFIDGSKPIQSPEDLRDHTLIHVSGPQGVPGTDWQEWLKTAGVDGIDTSRGLVFDDTAVAILAAIGGQGILLARRALVKDDIAAGRLALPFEIDLPLDFAWHIVVPDEKLKRSEVSAFRDWLLSEAQLNETD
ncbi:MAG: transcriptional regulator GcvA [Rhodospirillaceae bacterium]|nr:transcriptional regulator GcvA [Rhodospirillaceae bacterium]